MAKKMKRKTLVALLIVSTVVAVGGVLGIVESTSGGVSKIFEEENESSGKFVFSKIEDYVVKDLTDENTLTQKAEIQYQGIGPFDKITFNMNLYDNKDEDAGIDVLEDVVLFKNVSKLQIKLSLAEDIDYYVSSFTMPTLSFYDEDGQVLTNEDETLSYDLKVGRHNYSYFDGPNQGVCVANNAYSGNVIITIMNPFAKEGKDSYFSLGDTGLVFNVLDSNSWAYPV